VKTISEEEAKRLGLGRLTTPYSLPREQQLLSNAVEDMRRGNIEHAIVEVAHGVEIWRANIRRSEQPFWDE
jgi:hypothetical protein